MAKNGNAPRNITWVICLILFAVALLSHFGFIHPGHNVGDWSWIIGFALLLIATQVRGL